MLLLLCLLPYIEGTAQDSVGMEKELRYEQWVAEAYDCIERGQGDSAVVLFSKALALLPSAPTNYMLRSNLAEIHLVKKDTALALSQMHEAIMQQPDMIALRERRAEILGKMGRYDVALLDYDHIVTLHPERERSLFNRALLKTEMKLYDGAARDLETIILNNDKAYLPRIALASVERLRGNATQAERIYSYLISSFPKIPVAYRERARLYISQERKALALKDMRDVMKMPEVVTYEDYLLRGHIWLMYGERREARRDFDKARELGAPDDQLKQYGKL